MKILVSGSHGLVGSALIPALTQAGHQIVPLIRSPSQGGGETVRWDPATGMMDLAALERAEAEVVIHLAGENVAGGRWTAKRKQAIRDSRVSGTQLLAKSLAGLRHRPRALLSASAIGIYGNRGSELLSESSAPGSGFLADVCRAWESATAPAEAAGVRVVHLRFGVILALEGGALPKILPPFRLGLGGRLGSGRQYWSWITLADARAAIQHALNVEDLAGPLNIVAPDSVTNRDFTRALGQALHRPALVPVPAWALRLAVGEMADESLLASARVEPRRLRETSFVFRDADLHSALASVLRF